MGMKISQEEKVGEMTMTRGTRRRMHQKLMVKGVATRKMMRTVVMMMTTTMMRMARKKTRKRRKKMTSLPQKRESN